MTYRQLYEDAKNKLAHGKITVGEYEKMIEPLNKEIEPEHTQPEREEGHWIDKTDSEWDGEWDDWQCSCCGSLITSMARNLNGVYLYCPHCGKRMEEEK